MQSEKEETFHKLHHNGKILLLPNIWDPIGAMMLQDLGYPAVATASSSMALSNGYSDGEQLPFEEVLFYLKKIVKSVSVPVTADVESAYSGDDLKLLSEHIKKLIDTGISGLNFEDSIHGKAGMIGVEEQVRKLQTIRKAADNAGSHIFINARVDVYIKGANLDEGEKLEEAIKRGRAYKDAGADGLYPIILKNKNHIGALVKEVGLPINLTLIPGLPGLDILQKMGVARVSLASGFLKVGITAMKNVAEKLLKYEGTEEATLNKVSSEYLEGLVKH